MKIDTITAPSHWASYLINGDASGLDDGESEIIDRWRKRHGVRAVHDVEDEGRFTWSYNLFNPESGCTGGNVAEYTCELHKRRRFRGYKAA